MSTASDLLKWAAARFHRSANDALGTKMRTRGVLTSGQQIDYAYGISVSSYRGQTILAHAGGDAGYRAFLLTLPDVNASVAVLCNVPADTGGLALGALDLLVPQALTPPSAEAAVDVPETKLPVETITLSLADLNGRSGVFFNSVTQTLVRFVVQNEVLHLHFQGQAFPMSALSDRRFDLTGVEMEVEFSLNNQSFSIVSGPLTGSTSFRVNESNLSAADLVEFAGTYQAPELDIPWRIKVVDSGLLVTWLKAEPVPLTFLGDDRFVSDWGTLQFRRKKAGDVGGFELSRGRIRNLSFDRMKTD
jgi:hypothetical protein